MFLKKGGLGGKGVLMTFVTFKIHLIKYKMYDAE